MPIAPFDLIADLACDPANGWSIGRFGAVGEFVRDPDEPARTDRTADQLEIVTARGAMRIAPEAPLAGVAWDNLSADGETWSHSVAFCVERPPEAPRVVTALGSDAKALRCEDRDGQLFDLGIGLGAVRVALRTRDEALIEALAEADGQPLFSSPRVTQEVLRAQPHRVLLSPAGRIEVFQPIPPPDGKSPIGPHTHLLPKRLAKDLPHSANTPLPSGLQSALNVHPRSPWRDSHGEKHPFDSNADEAFLTLSARFGLAEDAKVRARVLAEIAQGRTPEAADWPEKRRGRAAARITLRRLAAAGDARVQSWRVLWDRLPVEPEEDEEVRPKTPMGQRRTMKVSLARLRSQRSRSSSGVSSSPSG
jgi:hypothetical protein